VKGKPHAEPDYTPKGRTTKEQKRTSKRNSKIFVSRKERVGKKPVTLENGIRGPGPEPGLNRQ
jgi:hypothetical protein